MDYTPSIRKAANTRECIPENVLPDRMRQGCIDYTSPLHAPPTNLIGNKGKAPQQTDNQQSQHFAPVLQISQRIKQPQRIHEKIPTCVTPTTPVRDWHLPRFMYTAFNSGVNSLFSPIVNADTTACTSSSSPNFDIHPPPLLTHLCPLHERDKNEVFPYSASSRHKPEPFH